MSETTRRLRETSVVLVDCEIPAEMTIAQYRRSRHTEPQSKPRRWRLWQAAQSRVCKLYAS